jgi:hypothetical protein
MAPYSLALCKGLLCSDVGTNFKINSAWLQILLWPPSGWVLYCLWYRYLMTSLESFWSHCEEKQVTDLMPWSLHWHRSSTGWYTVNGRIQLWDYTGRYIDSSLGQKSVQRACMCMHMFMGIIVAFICCQILCCFCFWHLKNATCNMWIWSTIVISCNGRCHVHTVHYN